MAYCGLYIAETDVHHLYIHECPVPVCIYISCPPGLEHAKFVHDNNCLHGIKCKLIWTRLDE